MKKTSSFVMGKFLSWNWKRKTSLFPEEIKNLNRSKRIDPVIERVKKVLGDTNQKLIVMVRG